MWIRHRRATAPFVYVRLHGPSHDWLYAGSYADDDLAWWADRMAVVTRSEVVVLKNVPSLARRYPNRPEYYDALYVPRARYEKLLEAALKGEARFRT